jgi:hypothetical protein
MAGTRSPQKRVAHIQAMAGEIGAQAQIASHLVRLTIRAFYDFLAVACLTAGLIMLVNGRRRDAAIWGGLGILLALGWVAMKLAVKTVTRMMRLLREEWGEGPAATVREKGLDTLRRPQAPKRRPGPAPIRARRLHGH